MTLPTVGASTGTWGTELNAHLNIEHASDGTHAAITPTSITTAGAVTTGTLTTNGFIIPGTTIAELTISSGEITATKSFHAVDTESDDATDDLDTINGGADMKILILSPESGSRTIVVKHATGNIHLAGAADFSMTAKKDVIMLINYNTTWNEISRSANPA